MKMIGHIFYDKKVNRVFQVKAKQNKGFLCSDHCRYVGDSKTTIGRMQLSEDYIKNYCVKVGSYDKCKYLMVDEVIGHWRIIEN